MTLLTKKRIFPLIIVLVASAIIYYLLTASPEVKRGKPAQVNKVSVEVTTLRAAPFQIDVASYGRVKPRIQSTLQAQASGQITQISEQFREGGFFAKGQVLIKLDNRDHLAEVQSATANLLTAQQALQEEQARGEQAKIDWQRLGDGAKANDLVLRKPQLAAAKAKVMSMQALLDKAKLNLERTTIKAPFAGRVLKKYVDVGQVVNNSTQLADIYATDSVEIRLPIANQDLAFITLPEHYQPDHAQQTMPKRTETAVTFYANLTGEQSWQGKLVRTEGAIDETAQQLYVIGEITNPYQRSQNNRYPIKIGQYVQATIQGKTINNALVIPNETIYQGTYVYVVENGHLQRKNITVAWQNSSYSLIKSGLKAGETLVLTPLGQVSSGTPVRIVKGKTHAKPQSKTRNKVAEVQP